MNMHIVPRADESLPSEIDYGPVSVVVNGTTSTEKRTSVIEAGITTMTQLALSNTKGKLGTTVRADMVERGLDAIVNASAAGSFRPLAEYVAFRTGRSCHITNVKDFDSLGYALGCFLEAIVTKKNGGLTSKGTPNTDHQAHLDCIRLWEACHEAREAQKKADAERRAAERAALEQPKVDA